MRLIRSMVHLSMIRLLMVFVLVSFLYTAAFADGSHDRTQVGRNITIAPDEVAEDVTCFGCSVLVRGHVSSDVTAFGGSVFVEDQGVIDGDLTTFGGNILLDKGAKVSGDVTVFGGHIRRDPSASIGGDVTNMGGPGWLVLIVLIPFIVLGGFIALIVWLIRRLTRPSVAAPA
ncbi:MAG TPA: hypothetical protein VMD99_04130 [Terriglobales bacterium]|nr:hypothetical protein [Terriglobales bacterium]HUA14076.1 hypothetical protein [Verrucomicrobiae bacterium]